MFDLGDPVPLTFSTTDANGVPANAGSVALTITLPDGTTSGPTPVSPASTGVYTYAYATSQAGRHVARWVATGANASAYVDAFDVRPADPGALISLADAKEHLNITSTSSDEELRGCIEAATNTIESLVGPVGRRQYSEVHGSSTTDVLGSAVDVMVGGLFCIALHRPPVISLDTVTALITGGFAFAPTDVDLDSSTGTLRRLDGAYFWGGPWRITYTAGRPIIPAAILTAARVLVAHLWRTQYGSSRGLPSLGGGDDYAVTQPVPGFGFAIPNRVLELLEPFRRASAVA